MAATVAAGQRWIAERARRSPEEGVRRRFLGAVPDHARIAESSRKI